MKQISAVEVVAAAAMLAVAAVAALALSVRRWTCAAQGQKARAAAFQPVVCALGHANTTATPLAETA